MVGHSVGRSVGHTVGRSVIRSVGRSVIHSVIHSFIHSVTPSIGRSRARAMAYAHTVRAVDLMTTRHIARASMTIDDVCRAFARDGRARAIGSKAAHWRANTSHFDDIAWTNAIANARAENQKGLNDVEFVYAARVARANGAAVTRLCVGDDALARVKAQIEGNGEVVRAVTIRGATKTKSVREMFDDERAMRDAMYDAGAEEENAFRANAIGRVGFRETRRRANDGRGGATVASVGKVERSEFGVVGVEAAGANVPRARDETKETKEAKQKDAGAKKSHDLMSMFSKAPVKKEPAKKEPTAKSPAKKEPATKAKVSAPVAVVAKKEEIKPQTVVKKTAVSAEAAILEEEEDASDDDSDDDFRAARKPRRKRAMAVESEDDDEDVMEIEESTPVPTPKVTAKPKKTAPTPSPKKTPRSVEKTPPSAKRELTAASDDDEGDDDEEEVPSSRPTSASKKQKKEKPLSKKALLARRIKKTIEIMDEETGEETTQTIFVDEFENELNEDGSYKYPENVKTAANE